MKAGQWDPKQGHVVVNEIPIPEPGPGQLLIKMISASLCHSDFLAMGDPNRTEPITLGHEGCGCIFSLHRDAEDKGFQKGDVVGFLSVNGACFECEGCQVHNTLCERGNPQIVGFSAPGFFAEYAVVDWQNAIHLPAQWDPKSSSPFFCAGLTSFNSVDSCGLQPGQWLAVVGAGGLGQLATQYAKAMSLRVIAIDVSDSTLQVCKEQGADYVYNSKGDPAFAQKIRELTGGGVHAAAVYSAAKAAYTTATMILRTMGLLMIVGVTHEPIPVSTQGVAIGLYRIKGENYGVPQRMKRAIDFSVLHGIKPEVDFRKLDDLGQMVQEMKSGTATKRRIVIF
ncbi:Alcohol dehydrogenase GroES-like domain-containing protein [Cladophialophora immunda]|nr:Alcohol dehydrogenase GroES-like domain-containing protein [Cladophialophora immunda]